MTTPLSHGDGPVNSSLPPATAGCPAADTAAARLHHQPVILLACLAITLLGGQALPAQPPSGALPPTELSGLRFTNPFFPGAIYRATVPSLETLLGFPASQRAASAAEIERCLKAWTAAAPDRTRLVEYARSHEGRPLHSWS